MVAKQYLPKQDLKRLGSALRRHRQQSKLSQFALAKLTGVSNQQMNNIEGGRCWPSLPAYVVICRALGMGTLPLFDGKIPSVTIAKK